MPRTFYELVIEGPFTLVKGFVLGFLSREEPLPRYFFHRKEGIRRETLREVLAEVLPLENFVYICLEERVVSEFEKAVKRVEPILELRVRSRRKILGAEFRFSFEVYNEELADEIKRILQARPRTAELMDFREHEEVNDETKGLAGYTPTHRYRYSGSGKVTGDFEGVIDFYLLCKRCTASEFIQAEEVRLKLEEGEQAAVE
jgi:hypothetical protein